MKTLRVYIDTSVLGGCFEPEFAIWSMGLLRDFHLGLFIPIVSDVLAVELGRAPADVQALYTTIAGGAERVTTSSEANALVQHYMTRGILGARHRNDMLHIALATVAEADVLVSWNFKHIVRFDKIRLINAANFEMGYKELRIHSPREVTTHDPEADT